VSMKLEVETGLPAPTCTIKSGVGHLLEVAAPRGNFTLAIGRQPSGFYSSAGVGATPVLAMLHSPGSRNLAPAKSGGCSEPVNGEDSRVLRRESRNLVEALPARQKASLPTAARVPEIVRGRGLRCFRDVSRSKCSRKLGVPRGGDSICAGLPPFSCTIWSSGTNGLGRYRRPCAHRRLSAQEKPITPGVVDSPRHAAPHPPAGPAGFGPTSVVCTERPSMCGWNAKFSSLLDFAEACDVPVRWSCRNGGSATLCEKRLNLG